MLFNMYMKPLGAVIRSFGVRCHQYADDMQLYFSFSSSSGEAVEVLNWCLAATMDRMKANKLKFNPDKTEGMTRPKGYPREMEGLSLPAPGIPCVVFR